MRSITEGTAHKHHTEVPTGELLAHVLQLFGKEGVTQQRAGAPDRAATSRSLQISLPDRLTLLSEENRRERERQTVALEERPFN